MARIKKIICIGISLALAAAIATGCAKKDSNAFAGESVTSKVVKTITTTSESYVETVEYEGFVTAKSIKNLSFGQSGKISTIYAQVGQRIKEGDLLAELDATYVNIKIKDTYTSSINSLKLSYNNAKDSYEKYGQLFNEGVISKKEYDDVKFAYDSIVIELNKAEQAYAADLALQLSETEILSPVDGYVIDISANAGEIIGAGAPVIILKSIEQIVTIGVSVNDLSKISVGMKVDMDFTGTSFSGMVSSVGQYPDENSRTYAVEITPETNDIPAGALVSVKIPIETRRVVTVPVNAMFAINGVNYVYCVEKEEGDRYKAVMKEILPGDVYGSNIIALNLAPGVMIVADNVKSIKENDWLSIIE